MTVTEIAAICVAVVAASGAWINARYGRLARVESRVATLEARNNRMWMFLRQQQDHAYRNGYTPLSIPDDLYGEDKK